MSLSHKLQFVTEAGTFDLSAITRHANGAVAGKRARALASVFADEFVTWTRRDWWQAAYREAWAKAHGELQLWEARKLARQNNQFSVADEFERALSAPLLMAAE